MIEYAPGQKPMYSLVTSGRISGGLAGMDSDLEAFSHNPTDDSFGALAVQPTVVPNI